MAFFEPPPPPEAPYEPEPQPAWFGPPENVLPAAVPLSVMLARTETAAVAVEGGFAYPAGFMLKLVVRRRSAEYDDMAYDPLHPRGPAAKGLPPELLRFGIQFSDGRKATNVGSRFPSATEEPEGPVFTPRGGGGGGGYWDHDFWVWPLPPEGPLGFVCEWPSEGIGLTRTEVDSAPIREAAGRAQVLWPDDPRNTGERGFTYRALGFAGDDS